MATVAPPPSKRQKRIAGETKIVDEEKDRHLQQRLDEMGTVRVQFVDQATGKTTGPPTEIKVIAANVKNLETLLNAFTTTDSNPDKIPYRFSFHPTPSQPTSDTTSAPTIDITSSLYTSLLSTGVKSTEDLITLHYTPLSVFRVRAATRCSASISGHGSAILATQFSPASSSRMVSGSGDGTARIWDCDTGTPAHTLDGKTGWVLAVAYSPDGDTIATGTFDGPVGLWDAKTGKPGGAGTLRGHRKWVTSLAWEPYHLQKDGVQRVASASKDQTVRIWNTGSGQTLVHFTRHLDTVSCVRWGGDGRVYSGSHDKTVKIWDSETGAQLKSLDAHAHWVNHLALSTDFVLRTGFFDHTGIVPPTEEAKRAKAEARWRAAATINGEVVERLVCASDDNTLFLYSTNSLTKPIARLTGHLKSVNHVAFSPDGHYIASSGFDNITKLWRASDGAFLRNFKGHVAPVYQSAFSADGKMIVTSSKDMTVKVWNVDTGKLREDLIGHKDEVFAVDWAPDGGRVGSGSKDKTVRIWAN